MATKTTDTIPTFTSPRDILSIDPGDVISAWVVWRPWKNPKHKSTPFKVCSFGRKKNPDLRNAMLKMDREGHLMLIEMPRASGIPVSNELFETCVQIGMYRKLWLPGQWGYVFRGDVKIVICGASNVKDPNVRNALIEYWGGEQRAMGGKKCGKCKGKGWFGAGRPTCPGCQGKKWEIDPGPLMGMAEDEWAALGVAYWYHMEDRILHKPPPPKSKPKKKKPRGRGKRTSVAAKR